MQPFIYPYALSFYEDYINLAKELNCKGIIVESLKMTKLLSKEYKFKVSALNEVIGYDVFEWYKTNGQLNGTDYMLKLEQKQDYISKLKAYANKEGIDLLVGENEKECRCQGCSGECCGTYLLKGHNIIENINNKVFHPTNITHALDNCKVQLRNKSVTLKELLEKQKK